jgi:hypothetical protein
MKKGKRRRGENRGVLLINEYTFTSTSTFKKIASWKEYREIYRAEIINAVCMKDRKDKVCHENF